MLRSEVQEFIRTFVKSVRFLELLLLLRTEKSRVWTSEALIGELRASHKIVNDAVALFSQAGIVRETEDGIIFNDANPFNAVIEQCAADYSERPSMVIKAIIEDRDEKLQAFSDAFRFKRD